MHNFLAALDTYQPKQDYVLAVILDTKGSTYRKAGALMLIDESLRYWGLLSGGCLEGDIQTHCETVFTGQSDKLVCYDMRGEEDLLWGMGLGCDGAINLLLKYLPSSNDHYGVFKTLRQVKAGQNYLLGLARKPPHQLEWLPLARGQSQIDWHDDTLTIPNPLRAMSLAKALPSRLLVAIPAPLHILICGASPDVIPVVAIAAQLGWKTTVIDHRPEFVKPKIFAEAEAVQLIKRKIWDEWPLEKFDIAIVMSHQFDRDKAYLARLLDSHINYIGLLGPSKRRNQLLQQCHLEFAQVEGRVFAPIGLDIGADTPETIALAIIAEIQATQSGKAAGFCYQDETR